MSNIPLPDEYRDMIVKWVNAGAMKFRWPFEGEEHYKDLAARWQMASQAFAALKLEDFLPQVRKGSKGPVIDAWVDFIQNVPGSNSRDLANSYGRVSKALGVIGKAIEDYKTYALGKLVVLHKQLDENDDPAWRNFWNIKWLPGPTDKEIDQRARALIKVFDDSMARQKAATYSTIADAKRILSKEREVYRRIADRFRGFKKGSRADSEYPVSHYDISSPRGDLNSELAKLYKLAYP